MHKYNSAQGLSWCYLELSESLITRHAFELRSLTINVERIRRYRRIRSTVMLLKGI